MILRRRSQQSGFIDSALYDQDTFYSEFLRSISSCRQELIIESPFITSKRMAALFPELQKLRRRGVKIVINTRSPEEHEGIYREQAADAVARMQALGIKVLYTTRHHRKISVIDRKVVWEGSLNILSYNDSCEIMRKVVSPALAEQTIRFIGLERHLA